MMEWLSHFLDDVSEFFAPRKGLLPLMGLGLIVVNFVLVLIFDDGFLVRTNLFLHLGVILSIFGLMLARAL